DPATPQPADTTAPAGSLTINAGVAYTASTSVTLALAATDTVGVTAYYLATSATPPAASAAGWTTVPSTTNYAASLSYALSAGDATKTLYTCYKDAAANASTTHRRPYLRLHHGQRHPPARGPLRARRLVRLRAERLYLFDRGDPDPRRHRRRRRHWLLRVHQRHPPCGFGRGLDYRDLEHELHRQPQLCPERWRDRKSVVQGKQVHRRQRRHHHHDLHPRGPH